MKPTTTIRHLTASLIALCGLAEATLAATPYAAWIQEYDPTFSRSQDAAAVATDAKGNVIVTGIARDASDIRRFYTAKYDALDGHKIWEAFEQAGNINFEPKAIAVDSAGDVIVTGFRNSGSIDFYTVKYHGSSGARSWTAANTSGGTVNTFNGTAGGQDEAVKVVTDLANNVFVTGFSRGNNNGGNASGFDIVTIKYAADGSQTAIDTYPTPGGNGDDVPTSMFLDGLGRVVVAGKVTIAGTINLYVRRLSNSLATPQTFTKNIGGDAGAAAVAVDGSNNVVVTGQFRTTGTNQHGFYVAGLAASNLALDWETSSPALSTDLIGQPTDLATDKDNNVIVTGFLKDASGDVVIKTIKYQAGGLFGGAFPLWSSADTIDKGLGVGDSFGRALAIDGAGHPIVIGESENEDGNTDFYIAQYDGATGKRTFANSFDGTFSSSADKGVDVARDGTGGFVALGTGGRDFNGTGRNEIVTIKFDLFIATTGDALPGSTIYSSGNSPAVADNGAVAASVKVLSGKTKLSAILAQSAAGDTILPAVQKGDAVGVTGAKYASFFDPVIAPNGQYAFVAKMTGAPGSGVWTNLGGTYHLALQTGKPVPGMTENLSTVMSLSLNNSRLLALVKVAGPASSNLALVSINAANAGTVILRTGQSLSNSTVKKISIFTPAKSSPGDGRWANGNSVAVATMADKRTLIVRGSNDVVFTAGSVTQSPMKSFGPPAIGGGAGTRVATLARLNLVAGNVSAANDYAVIRTDNMGMGLETPLREGGTPADASLTGTTFVSFSDPIVNSDGALTLFATIKGAGVTAKNKQLLLSGITPLKVVRTGDLATDSAGNTGTAVWSSLVSFVSPQTLPLQPIFVAKLSGAGVTAKNNLGVWARDSSGKVRRLLRTGDVLGTQTVKSFTLLKAVSTATATARSFNNTGSIAALVNFTDGKQALIKIGLP